MAATHPPLAGNPELIDSWRAWLVAIGAGLSCGMAFGTIYTFGAFIESMSTEFGSGQGGASVMLGIATFLFFGTGIISGPLLHHVGPRPLLLVGGALFVGGLVATSSVSQLWHGYVVYGIGCGFGSGMFISPLFATSAAWFLRQRAVSQGLVATGPGLGTMVLVPLAQRLIDNFGWRIAFRYLALIAAIIVLVCFMLVRRTPLVATVHPREHVRRVMRTKAFWQLTIGSTLFAVPVIGSLAAIIPFARSAGISASAAAWLVSIIGASSIFGRLLLTSFARALGSVRLLKISFAMLPVAYVTWFFASDRYLQMVAFAVILGVGYGGFVALMGDVTPHLFGVAGIGTVLGRLFFCYAIGSMVGPIAMLTVHESSGGTSLPIAIVAVAAALGVLTIWMLPHEPVLVEETASAPAQGLPLQLSPPNVWMPVPASSGRGS
ncbi:MFS transporter [Candidatus Poriferisodalis sp.]|uniref:MFS transporter n=1 Tax=Candidatus Poriferisodalis sp. TaxID=3101277 RepID=UPI003C6F767D